MKCREVEWGGGGGAGTLARLRDLHAAFGRSADNWRGVRAKTGNQPCQRLPGRECVFFYFQQAEKRRSSLQRPAERPRRLQGGGGVRRNGRAAPTSVC